MQPFQYQVRAIRLSTGTVMRQLYELDVSPAQGGKVIAAQMFCDAGDFGPEWEIISERVNEQFFLILAKNNEGVRA